MPYLHNAAEETAFLDEVRLGQPHHAIQVVGDAAHSRRLGGVAGMQGP
ncbi:MAG: hypothetical protein ACRDN1_02045 [Trebonia sp.]